MGTQVKMKRHILVGFAAAMMLLLVYSAIILWAQGKEHFLQQSLQLWYWILALAAGFGIQAGLFSSLRQGMKPKSKETSAAMATSGGVSTGSMIACCAHHVSDVLPVLGLSSVAIFVVKYQLFFIIAGVLSNIVGIIIMLDAMQHCGLSARLNNLRFNFGQLKKGAIALSLFILAGVFFFTYGKGV